MAKGLLILFIVFTTVGMLHVTTLRLIKTAEHKKQKIRKVFWYIYGVVFSISGIVNLVPADAFDWGFDWVFVVQWAFGVGIIVLNFLGRIETKNPNTMHWDCD